MYRFLPLSRLSRNAAVGATQDQGNPACGKQVCATAMWWMNRSLVVDPLVWVVQRDVMAAHSSPIALAPVLSASSFAHQCDAGHHPSKARTPGQCEGSVLICTGHGVGFLSLVGWRGGPPYLPVCFPDIDFSLVFDSAFVFGLIQHAMSCFFDAHLHRSTKTLLRWKTKLPRPST